jgi:hypothetical protein
VEEKMIGRHHRDKIKKEVKRREATIIIKTRYRIGKGMKA